MDATIVEAPGPTKNKAGERDPEMRQTKKGNQWHFGMKTHIGVDAETGLATIWRRRRRGDGAWRRRLPGRGQSGGEPGRRRGLADGDTARPEAAAEKAKASVRAKVEHPFLYLKGA